MIRLILGKFWGLILGAGALLAIYAKGRSDAREKAAQRELEDYKDTRERMDAVDTPDDADTARDWLRDRSKR